jgi:hypothetical protein
MHGRFVKSSKKSITELAKAYKGQSMGSSMVSKGSSPGPDGDEGVSRKSSFQDMIQSMAKLNINPPDSPHKKMNN